MALSKTDAVAELVGQAVRMAQSLEDDHRVSQVDAIMAKHLLQLAVESLAGDRALELKLTPVGPISTPGAELRKAWQVWYLHRYSEPYAWSATEASHAKRLMTRAGDRGVAEVMRRAEIAAAQSWRTSNVTLGVLVASWNALATDVAEKKTFFKGGNSRSGI